MVASNPSVHCLRVWPALTHKQPARRPWVAAIGGYTHCGPITSHSGLVIHRRAAGWWCLRHDGPMLVGWRLRCFVLAVPCVLLVVACGRGSAAPNLSPVSSGLVSSVLSSASASVSSSVPVGYPADVPLSGHNVRPGEKPPVYPAAARVRSQDGANAFAEFFMRTLDWAYATTNPSYMEHYYGPSCGLCSGIATGIAKTAAEHHWYEGGRIAVRPAQTAPVGDVTAPAEFCSRLDVGESATAVVDTKGNIVGGDGAHSDDRLKLCSTSAAAGTWQVTYLAFVS